MGDNAVDLVIANRLSEIGKLHAAVEEFGEKNGLASELMFKLQLACEEMVTNIISYAFEDDAEHAITISFTLQKGEVMVMISDDGKPFSPAQAVAPDLAAPLEDRAIGGLGIHLVKSYMDSVEYRRVGDRNQVTLTKSLQRGGLG